MTPGDRDAGVAAAALAIGSPLGPLVLEARCGALSSLRFGGSSGGEPTPLLAEAARWLQAYFAGDVTAPDFPLAPARSAFQDRMRAAMLAIPYGQTRSYGEIAAALRASPRAVGQACGRNPLPIIVPCHRVLAAGGAIGGYSGGSGTATKRYLLAHESPPPLFPGGNAPT